MPSTTYYINGNNSVLYRITQTLVPKCEVWFCDEEWRKSHMTAEQVKLVMKEIDKEEAKKLHPLAFNQ